MKTFLVIVVSCLVTAGLAGAGVYYLLNNKVGQNKDSLQSQINDLASKYTNSQGNSEDTSNSNIDDSNSNSVSASTSTAATNTNQAAASTSNTPTDAFSLAKLKTATVVVSDVNYQLSAGKYTHPGVAPFDPEVPATLTLDQKNIAVDTTNPNQAAIIVAIGGMRHAGATVNCNELEIMTNNNGAPKYLTRVLLDGYTQTTVSSISFASNVVSVTYVPIGGTSTTTVHKLINNVLVKQ